MSNICAGIGRGQIEVLDAHVAKRRAMHDFYEALFKDHESITVLSEISTDYFSNFWLSALTIDIEKKSGKTSEDLRLLLETENIESRPLWKPMHLQPVFADAPYYGGSVSEKLFEQGLCLPSGSNLSMDDMERIKRCLNTFLK